MARAGIAARLIAVSECKNREKWGGPDWYGSHATVTKNPQPRKRLRKTDTSRNDWNSIQVAPIRPRTYFDQQRNGDLVDAFHFFSYQFRHHLELIFGQLKDQLVVHLQNHFGVQVHLGQTPVNTDHGQLDKVRGSSLQRRIECGALREITQ